MTLVDMNVERLTASAVSGADVVFGRAVKGHHFFRMTRIVLAPDQLQ